MRNSLRWVALASLAVNVLLVQALGQTAGEIASLNNETAAYRSTIAALEAERESAAIELAVLNVLESHRLRVSPETRHGIANTIIEAGHRYGLSPELILAVIFTESSFIVDAESSVGALGLMQLMPATASQMAAELEMEWKGHELLNDPQVNILLGSFYLQKLIHRFEDLDSALVAYNMGPNRLRSLMRRNRRVPNTYSSKVQQVSQSLRERFF